MLSRIVLALIAGLLLVAAVETFGNEQQHGCGAAYAAPPGIGSYAAPPCDGRERS